VLKTGLHMCLPEKNRDSDRIRCRGVRFLQSGFRRIIAKYGHFLHILEEEEPTFSAIRTAWRSGVDSNPRYRSETCKSRRLRKLRGVNQFRNSPRLPAPSRHAKTVRFREGSRGEALAIVWLKVVAFRVPSKHGFALDCLPSGQSFETFSRGWIDEDPNV
jgi:hypothetical protein